MYFGSACDRFLPGGAGFGGFGLLFQNLAQIAPGLGITGIDFNGLFEILLRRRPFLVRHRVYALPIGLLGRRGRVERGGRNGGTFMQADPLQHNSGVVAQGDLNRPIALQPDADVAHVRGGRIVRPGPVIDQVLHAAVAENIHNRAFLRQPLGKRGDDLRRGLEGRAVFGDDGGVEGLGRSGGSGRQRR